MRVAPSVGGDGQRFQLPRRRKDDPLADIGDPVGDALQIMPNPEQMRGLLVYLNWGRSLLGLLFRQRSGCT